MDRRSWGASIVPANSIATFTPPELRLGIRSADELQRTRRDKKTANLMPDYTI